MKFLGLLSAHLLFRPVYSVLDHISGLKRAGRSAVQNADYFISPRPKLTHDRLNITENRYLKEIRSFRWNKDLLTALNAALYVLAKADELPELGPPCDALDVKPDIAAVNFPDMGKIQGALRRALDTGELWFGTDFRFPPYSYLNPVHNGDGEKQKLSFDASGYEVDLIKRLTGVISDHYGKEHLDVRLVWLETEKDVYSKAMDALRNDRIDVFACSLSRTINRGQDCEFSSPYLRSGGKVLVSRADSKCIRDPSVGFNRDLRDLEEWDRENQTIGIVDTEVHRAKVKQEMYRAKFRFYDDVLDLQRALLANDVTAVVMDECSGMWFAANDPEAPRIAMGPSFGEYNEEIRFIVWKR